jgi:hypothetical protein
MQPGQDARARSLPPKKGVAFYPIGMDKSSLFSTGTGNPVHASGLHPLVECPAQMQPVFVPSMGDQVIKVVQVSFDAAHVKVFVDVPSPPEVMTAV